MISIAGKKLAEELAVSSFTGMWLPCFVMLPIGVLLTYQAMHDLKNARLPHVYQFHQQTNTPTC